MIKETVDAVRLAELEGDKVISTAKVNGQDMKNQVKIQGAEYRTERSVSYTHLDVYKRQI